MRPLYRWLLTFFFTQIHPSTFYARNTHPVPFLLSPGPIFAIESSPTRPSVIFLYKAGHNIVLFSPQPTLTSAFAQFGRHVTRDGTLILLWPCQSNVHPLITCSSTGYIYEQFLAALAVVDSNVQH
ncbi:hypothetical protein F5887DRAFT_567458 [Amanita rubescens]|nr:hypothetical protein F5887DRAFT_567458 [Amanita rubescens]